MKSLSFFILMIGVVFITIGYMDNKVKNVEVKPTREYMFVPRTIYDEQIRPVNLSDTFSAMFSEIDPIFEDK